MFFFPRGVLDEILNLIESVSEGFPSYFFLFKLYLYLDSKLFKYVRSYLFCLGDLYFQTVDVLRGKVTTDIIVIYNLLFPWSRGWV